MFGMGMGEILIILIVALLVLGPDKLPGAAKAIGRGIRQLRKHTRDLQDTIEQDEDIGGTVREIRSALRDDPPPMTRPRPRPQARPLTPVEERYARGEKEPEAPKPDEPAPPPSSDGPKEPEGGSTANG